MDPGMVKLPITLCGNDPQYCPCGNIHGQIELDAVLARLRPFTIYFATKSNMLIHLVGHNCTRAAKCRSMIAELEKSEIYDPLKAARWLGYAIRLFEEVTGTSNELTRAWVRRDVRGSLMPKAKPPPPKSKAPRSENPEPRSCWLNGHRYSSWSETVMAATMIYNSIAFDPHPHGIYGIDFRCYYLDGSWYYVEYKASSPTERECESIVKRFHPHYENKIDCYLIIRDFFNRDLGFWCYRYDLENPTNDNFCWASDPATGYALLGDHRVQETARRIVNLQNPK